MKNVICKLLTILTILSIVAILAGIILPLANGAVILVGGLVGLLVFATLHSELYNEFDRYIK